MVDRKLAKRARKQIEVAHALLRALSLEKLDEVTDEINKAVAKDLDFQKEVSRHPLNLNIFLTSAEASKTARSSFDQCYAMGSVTHNCAASRVRLPCCRANVRIRPRSGHSRLAANSNSTVRRQFAG